MATTARVEPGPIKSRNSKSAMCVAGVQVYMPFFTLVPGALAGTCNESGSAAAQTVTLI